MPEDDRMTTPRVVISQGWSLYNHQVRFASSGQSLAANDIIKFLSTLFEALAKSSSRIPSPFRDASLRRERIA